jgi:hypothetical protein
MQQEKKLALEAIRNLIAYYTSDFHVGSGYTGKQQLIYLTRPQAEIALRYGIPIGVRDKHCTLMGTTPGKPFRYVTIKDIQTLEKWLAFSSMEPLASIHADLPKGIQQKMREYILQIMEFECPEQLPPQKPVAPILGAYGNIFNLLCITNRALRQAGQLEQAEEMWRRVLDSGDNFKALAIMGEYVEFDEAYLPAAALCGNGSRGGGHG